MGNNMYEKRKKKGLCVTCGKELPDEWEYTQCTECKERQRIANRKLYYGRKKEEKCTICGEDISDFERSEVYCEECLEYIHENMNQEENWHKYHMRKLNDELNEMPDYMKEQFFEALEDLSITEGDDSNLQLHYGNTICALNKINLSHKLALFLEDQLSDKYIDDELYWWAKENIWVDEGDGFFVKISFNKKFIGRLCQNIHVVQETLKTLLSYVRKTIEEKTEENITTSRSDKEDRQERHNRLLRMVADVFLEHLASLHGVNYDEAESLLRELSEDSDGNNE